MIQSSKKLLVLLGGLSVLLLYVSMPNADARPQYLKSFKSSYPKLEQTATRAKCELCHEDQGNKHKGFRNVYGRSVRKGLTKKNEKNEKLIAAAIKNAETASSPSGKTFGEMIEAGELPK